MTVIPKSSGRFFDEHIIESIIEEPVSTEIQLVGGDLRICIDSGRSDGRLFPNPRNGGVAYHPATTDDKSAKLAS